MTDNYVVRFYRRNWEAVGTSEYGFNDLFTAQKEAKEWVKRADSSALIYDAQRVCIAAYNTPMKNVILDPKWQPAETVPCNGTLVLGLLKDSEFVFPRLLYVMEDSLELLSGKEKPLSHLIAWHPVPSWRYSDEPSPKNSVFV